MDGTCRCTSLLNDWINFCRCATTVSAYLDKSIDLCKPCRHDCTDDHDWRPPTSFFKLIISFRRRRKGNSNQISVSRTASVSGIEVRDRRERREAVLSPKSEVNLYGRSDFFGSEREHRIIIFLGKKKINRHFFARNEKAFSTNFRHRYLERCTVFLPRMRLNTLAANAILALFQGFYFILTIHDR